MPRCTFTATHLRVHAKALLSPVLLCALLSFLPVCRSCPQLRAGGEGSVSQVRCGIWGHFAGRSGWDFSSHLWLCAAVPGSSGGYLMPVPITVMAPDLVLLVFSHISSFNILHYRYLNIITVDFIALRDKIKKNENQ